MGVVREYLDYSSERQAIYDGLLGTARGIAVGLERDLQLRVSALETLAMSPVLTADDPSQFDQQAAAFLARQPPGTLLGLATPDLRLVGYGRDGKPFGDEVMRDSDGSAAQVFATKPPGGHEHPCRPYQQGCWDSPSTCRSSVAGALSTICSSGSGLPSWPTWSPASTPPPGTVLTVTDASGRVVARLPEAARFLRPVVPALWNAMQTHREGIVKAPTLEGAPAVAAYTQYRAV